MYGQADDTVELIHAYLPPVLPALQPHLAKRRCRDPVSEQLLSGDRCLTVKSFG
jgi:hypothetical protein